jgi:hypothetical protein
MGDRRAGTGHGRRRRRVIRVEAGLATFEEREEAVGTARWLTLEERYLRV